MRALIIMSFDQFHDACVTNVHHLHFACVASLFHMTFDEIIRDAYDNEFDDFAIIDHNDFCKMIDHIYTHFVN